MDFVLSPRNERTIACLTFTRSPKQHPSARGIPLLARRRHTTPPTMSSPEQRRSNRSSVNGTPRRSASSSQAPASSPALPNNGNNAAADEQLRSEADDANMQDVTPRGNTRSSQNISQSQAPPTSSPLFYRSSPNGSQSQSQQGGRAGGASSPLKSHADVPSSDGARTPRASGMMMGGGMFWEEHILYTFILMQRRLLTNSLRFQLRSRRSHERCSPC